MLHFGTARMKTGFSWQSLHRRGIPSGGLLYHTPVGGKKACSFTLYYKSTHNSHRSANIKGKKHSREACRCLCKVTQCQPQRLEVSCCCHKTCDRATIISTFLYTCGGAEGGRSARESFSPRSVGTTVISCRLVFPTGSIVRSATAVKSNKFSLWICCYQRRKRWGCGLRIFFPLQCNKEHIWPFPRLSQQWRAVTFMAGTDVCHPYMPFN